MSSLQNRIESQRWHEYLIAMTSSKLAKDYFWRCQTRLKVLDLLFQEKNFPDCIREAQELTELALKGILRLITVDPPHWHDVSSILVANKDRLPKELQPHLSRIQRLSQDLRRDRENSFYGDDDLVPTEVFTREQAERVLLEVKWLMNLLEKTFKL